MGSLSSVTPLSLSRSSFSSAKSLRSSSAATFLGLVELSSNWSPPGLVEISVSFSSSRAGSALFFGGRKSLTFFGGLRFTAKS